MNTTMYVFSPELYQFQNLNTYKNLAGTAIVMFKHKPPCSQDEHFRENLKVSSEANRHESLPLKSRLLFCPYFSSAVTVSHLLPLSQPSTLSLKARHTTAFW